MTRLTLPGDREQGARFWLPPALLPAHNPLGLTWGSLNSPSLGAGLTQGLSGLGCGSVQERKLSPVSPSRSEPQFPRGVLLQDPVVTGRGQILGMREVSL